tara:strand:- start:114 stop:275 length:162 start_codon:yes stop_codon:yes gene_type:complete
MRLKKYKAGWGGWIRTNDHETKTRCLAAWLHPNNTNMLTNLGEVINIEHRLCF